MKREKGKEKHELCGIMGSLCVTACVCVCELICVSCSFADDVFVGECRSLAYAWTLSHDPSLSLSLQVPLLLPLLVACGHVRREKTEREALGEQASHKENE